MSSNADIFATLLYAPCEGLPLWNPSPLELGDVGFVRDGSFHVLYNAITGPTDAQGNRSEASQMALAMRTTMSSGGSSQGGSGRRVSAAGLTAGGSSAGSAAALGLPDATMQLTPGDGRRASNASALTSAGSSTGTGGTGMGPSLSASQQQHQQQGGGATGEFATPVVGRAASLSPPPQPQAPSAHSTGFRRSSLTRGFLRRSQSPGPNVGPSGEWSGAAGTSAGVAPSGAWPSGSTSPPHGGGFGGGDEMIFPPMPLSVEAEAPRVFTMGARTSNNFRAFGASAGVDLGAAAVAVPVGGEISFETSGGDGAVLVPRDPVERTLLRHVGVLKAYFKAHRRWIFRAYGEPEDVEMDEIALIYGMDRTSDWGVSVTRDAAVGTKLKFEVFSLAKAGVWGDWRSSGSAAQRGPYREVQQWHEVEQKKDTNASTTVATPTATTHDTEMSRTASTVSTEGAGRAGSIVPMDLDADVQGVKVGLHFGNGGQNPDAAASSNGGGPTSYRPAAAQEALGYGKEWEWNKSERNPFPADQSIVLRRITAKHRMGLGFLPARYQAAAGPRRDGDDDASRSARRRRDGGGRCRSGPRGGCDGIDLLDLLHEIMLERAPCALVSIASDDDCLRLLEKARSHSQSLSQKLFSPQESLRNAADSWLDVFVDEQRFVQPSIRETPRVTRAEELLPAAARHKDAGAKLASGTKRRRSTVRAQQETHKRELLDLQRHHFRRHVITL